VRTLVKNPRRLLTALSAVVLAVGVSACGNKVNHPHSEPDVDGSASSGYYVDAGKPAITYQVQISRELNPYDTEDKTYLRGVSAADLSLAPSQEWFAVFLKAWNQSKVPATTAKTFTITDTQGNVYHPIPLNTAENDLAWTPTLLRPNQSQPLADSPSFYDATQGSLLLFKIYNDTSNLSAYSNRPLLLNIYATGQTLSRPACSSGASACISLDL
jgi:hypothetical protein